MTSDFIIDAQGNVVKRGLPALRTPPGLPVPFGPNGPTISPATAAEPRLRGGPSVPSAGGVPKPPTLGSRALSTVKSGGGPLLGLGLADAAVGADPEPGEFSVRGQAERSPTPSLINPLESLAGQGAQSAFDIGVSLENTAGAPDQSKGGDFLRILAGETLQAPARVTKGVKNIAEDPLAAAVKLKDNVKGGAEAVAKFAVDNVTPQFLDETFITRERLEQDRAAELAPKLVAQEQQQRQVGQLAEEMFKQKFGEGGTTTTVTEPFDLGNVQFPSAPNLPPPPPAADFSEVYATLQKTMPQDPNTEDLQTQQTLAVLAGMATGMLQMRNGNLGDMLLGAGIGGFAGQAQHDQTTQAAEAKFREDLNAYWLKLASVQKQEAENDASHAIRVWEHNNGNMLRQHSAAAQKAQMANQKVTQGKDGQLYLTSITDNGDGTGTRQIRTYKPGTDTSTAAGMMKVFKPLVGDKKAETIVSQILTAKSPEKAMGLYIVSKAKADGKYEGLLNRINTVAPDFLKEMSTVGQTIQGRSLGATEKERGELIQNERDAFLVDVILSNPSLLGLAGDTVGLTLPSGVQ